MSTAQLTLAGAMRVEVRVLGVLGALTGLLVVLAALHLGHGEYAIAPLDVLRVLAGGGEERLQFIVLELRLPRTAAAVLVGAALALAGAIFQDLTRNPLAAPDVVGVANGASVAAVAVIVFAGAPALVAPAALAGATAAGLALYLLAWRDGLIGYRLVLVGIGLAAAFDAAIAYLLTRGDIDDAAEAVVWLVGSVYARDWDDVVPLAIGLASLIPALLVAGRRLAPLQLGDDVARGLGVRTTHSRPALLGIAIALVGLAVAAAGPVLFVSFIAPHLARRLCPSAGPGQVLPVAAGCGAVLVLAADLVGRLLFAPIELPVGIVTAVIAAPYFLILLRRTNRQGLAT